MRTKALALAFLILAAPALAAELLAPDPALSPAEVVVCPPGQAKKGNC